jgi:hypothetical protein
MSGVYSTDSRQVAARGRARPVASAMSFPALRLNLTLLLISLYMLLDAAFMLIRIPPGMSAGVPMGELLIVFFFLTLPRDLDLVTPFFRSVPFVPLAIWWLVGATQLSFGIAEHGFWALRDATSLVESLFLWIGFVVAAVPGAVPKIIGWFKWILVLSVAIVLTYPFRDLLAAVSPVVMSIHMQPTPLFFTYNLTALMSLVTALWLFVGNVRVGGLRASWVAGLLLVFVAALVQQRTIYLQILFLFALLAATRPSNALRLAGPVVAGVAVFVALVALGVPVPGRVSSDVSLSFYFQHFLAIGGTDPGVSWESDAVRGAASGVNQRFLWWSVIWDNVTSTWTQTLFGLGYGISMVGLANDPGIDAVVREPHNSLVSALGRTGFVGLAAYVWLHIALAITAFRTYAAYKAKGFAETARWIYLLGAMFVIFWIAAIGEDAFEKPFIAIPYYFFFGVVLNLWYRDAYAPAKSGVSTAAAS